MTIHYTTDINDTNYIDKDKALLLIDASLQAYRIFDKKEVVAPEDYEQAGKWTGVDSLFGKDKKVEIYGIVFVSSGSGPATYIFAFRGTDSVFDILDDMGLKHKSFTPFKKGTPVPTGVEVEAGFFDVYSESDGPTESMQQQLFNLIDKYQASDRPIKELLITGHSLGSALSELFTLDLALARPEIKALNYNYACPRLGNSDFVNYYQSQPAQQKQETRTLRVQNTYDKVPCVPPQKMSYRHLGNAFLVAFYKDDGLEKFDLLKCHSSLAYNAVLNCAAKSEDGVCVAKGVEVVDPDNKDKSFKVDSEKPDPNKICSLW